MTPEQIRRTVPPGSGLRDTELAIFEMLKELAAQVAELVQVCRLADGPPEVKR
jgi:hypothetical protein